MLSAANEHPTEHGNAVGSVTGPASLSVKQREFALAYVLNGGKGTEAALAAGYGETGAHVAANRCLVNPKVGAEIQRLSRSLIHTALPTLIRELIELATDKAIAPRDRLKALNSLLERGGIATDKAGVQVAVGVQVNGSTAQALISEVWTQRSGRLSDIPPAMSDSMEGNLKAIEQAIDAPATTLPGGDRLKGSRPPHVSLPVHASTELQKPRVSCECETCRAMEPGYEPDDEEPDEFAAFLRGDDDAV